MDDATTVDGLFSQHIAHLQGVAQAALDAVGAPALVVGAGFPKYRFLDDQTHPFVANPHFQWWVPVGHAPGSFVLVRPGQRPTVVFHQPEDYWHKPPESLQGGWLEAVDVVVIRRPADARQHMPSGSAYVGEAFDGMDDFGFASHNAPPLLARLHWARARKTPYELACMRIAAERGARAHRTAEQAFRAGASEYGIHLAYLAACGHTEAGLPYPNIIALNEGSAILHYTELSSDVPTERRSFLIDAGAQFRGYACDITRSYAAKPGAYAELLTALDEAERRLCDLVRAGVHYPAIHAQAHREIAGILVDHGIVRCSTEAALETRLTSVFFPHGIGHLLGLQVHDIGGHQTGPEGGTTPPPAEDRYLRLTRTLEPSTVVTIEPGIYFIDLLLDAARQDGRGRDIDWGAVERLKPFGGVRVEDDVVATAQGPENLTRDAFARLA